MVSKDIQIFASFHQNDENKVLSFLEDIRTAGWNNFEIKEKQNDRTTVLESIRQSGMMLIFLSKSYARDDRLMIEEFAYSATVARKPFIHIWLDSLADIQKDYQNTEYDQQILSTLEMLTAKYPGTTAEGLIKELEQYIPDNTSYTPSTPQICEKPCEAYEGHEPYIFISYAHDDAPKVYPIVKKLYESGWDLWYDEGIKTTERYLPVIADNLRRCAAFVLMLTKRCLARPFVMNYELEYARRLGVPVIPVLLEGFDLPTGFESTLNPDINILSGRLASGALPNKGTRTAVPPAVKKNVVYDVVLPPEVPGFEYTVQGDTITIVKYVSEEPKAVIPATVATPDGSMVFKVVAIGDSAFSGCKSLTNITIPDNVTSIGSSAFSWCTSLTNITIPGRVTSIGDNAFVGCYSLTNITIPDSVTSIGEWAFRSCISLTGITIPDSVTSIDAWAFEDCRSLTNITIPNSVTSISSFAFSKCTSLTNITIPDSVLYISDSAFSGCPVYIAGKGSPDFEEENKHVIKKEVSLTKQDAPLIPGCDDAPCALLCCAKEDLQHIRILLIELYWEGFNIHYKKTPDQLTIEKSQCVLVFFSKNTSESEINTIKQAITINTARIIQVFLGDCTDWPAEIHEKLHDRQAIFQKFSSEQAFTGNIRDSLRQFGCSLGHPRGFDAKNLGDSVEIAKFHSTGFPHVIIPKTFFNPPLKVISIGKEALSKCTSLTGITIPDSVTSIGDDAFSYCCSLIGITIPDGVKSIGRNAFDGCNSLTDITIPDGVTSIGDGTFWGCNSLTDITIPDGVTSIGKNAFSRCTSLAGITIPDSVTSIGERAFKDCTSLTSITIPDSVTSIGYCAFSGAALSEIIVDNRNSVYLCREGVLFNKAVTTLIKYPSGRHDTYTVPDSVTSIDGAFSRCTSLIGIIIPDSVTSIGEEAFSSCTSLTNITIPDSVTSIGKSAFSGCKSLTSITIPHSVTSIGEEAFYDCLNLTIHAPRNSTAWQYAEREKIKCEPLGS